MADAPNGEGSVRFSIRELFADIKRELTELRADIARRDEQTARRLGRLEQEVAGVAGRVELHEALPGHPEGMRRLAATEASVQALASQAEARSALAAYVDRAGQRSAETQRWLIGLTLGSALTLGLAIARLLTQGHL